VTEETSLINPVSASISHSESNLTKRQPQQHHYKARTHSLKVLEESQPFLSDEEDEQRYGTVRYI